MSENIFLLALVLTASGVVSPPLALFGGLVYGFAVMHPFHVEIDRLARFLLQASVVALGFCMNLNQVEQAGRSGFVRTAVSIGVVMLLGFALGCLLRVGKRAAFLISAGTAICGGSAIAAVGPIADANGEEMAISAPKLHSTVTNSCERTEDTRQATPGLARRGTANLVLHQGRFALGGIACTQT